MNKGTKSRRIATQGWGSLAQNGGASMTPGNFGPGDRIGNSHGSSFRQLRPNRGGIELPTRRVVREPFSRRPAAADTPSSSAASSPPPASSTHQQLEEEQEEKGELTSRVLRGERVLVRNTDFAPHGLPIGGEGGVTPVGQDSQILANNGGVGENAASCEVRSTGEQQQQLTEEEEEEEERPPQQKRSSSSSCCFFLGYSPAAASNIACGSSSTRLLGKPLKIWDTLEEPPLEASLCGDETESSSSDGGDSTTSCSDDSDSSSDDESVRECDTASTKRGEWEPQQAADVEGFTRVEVRAVKRLAKKEKQRKVERERAEREAQAKEEDKRHRLIQRQKYAEDLKSQPHTRARAAKERQEAQAREANASPRTPGVQRGGVQPCEGGEAG